MSSACDEGEAIRSRLAERLAGFAAFLRANGFAAGPGELADALRILEARWRAGPQGLRPALKALFVRDRGEWGRFDPLFDAYFLGGFKVRTRLVHAGAPRGSQPATLAELGAARRGAGSPVEPEAGGRSSEAGGGSAAVPRPALASAGERRGAPDGRALLAAADGSAVEDLAERIGRRLAHRLVRRQRRARRGAPLDLPRTIRASVERGGWPLVLFRRRPRLRPMRLALLLDVSGSMQPWTRLYLRFLRGLLRLPWAEAWLFHTRLMAVGRVLRERDSERAAAALALLAEGIGGGTRIGETLAAFNRHHAARALRGRACAVLVSDGYETGPLDRLDRELAAIRRRARRLLWLDPLAGAGGDRAEVRALAVARRRADLVTAGGAPTDLAALERLFARTRRGLPRSTAPLR